MWARQAYQSQLTRIPPDLPLAIMDVVIGVLYLTGGNQRTAMANFHLARQIMPIWAWGASFALVGLLLSVALVRPRRRLVTAVRVIGPTVFVMWALVQLINAIEIPTAAMIGAPVYGYLAYRHSFAPALPERA